MRSTVPLTQIVLPTSASVTWLDGIHPLTGEVGVGEEVVVGGLAGASVSVGREVPVGRGVRVGAGELVGVDRMGCRVADGSGVMPAAGVKPAVGASVLSLFARRSRAFSSGAASGPSRHSQPSTSAVTITSTVPNRAGVIHFALPWRACAAEASSPGRNSVRRSSSYGWFGGRGSELLLSVSTIILG